MCPCIVVSTLAVWRAPCGNSVRSIDRERAGRLGGRRGAARIAIAPKPITTRELALQIDHRVCARLRGTPPTCWFGGLVRAYGSSASACTAESPGLPLPEPSATRAGPATASVAAAPLADCATLLGGGGGVAPISTPWLPPSFHQSSPPEPARPRQPRPRQALADSNYRGGARRLSDDGRRAQPGEQIVCRRCAAAGAGSRPRRACARPSDARPTPSCARRMSSWQLRG